MIYACEGKDPDLRCDYCSGKFLGTVGAGERPFIKSEHYETTIEAMSGASGCPVFFANKVVGISPRGWDFRGGEMQGEHLASVIPISELLPVRVPPLLRIPPGSWESNQIPDGTIVSDMTIWDLVRFGHVNLPG